MTDLNAPVARKAMIDSQLRTSGVNEEYVLARMYAVPRENFVPDEARAIAYMDRAVPLGDGRYLAAPVVQAMMLAEAAPTKDDSVLIVEGGTSYFAELIAPLVASVDRISPADAVEKAGRKTYSLIVVDGAIERLPTKLAKRLEDNGRIVTGLTDKGITRIAVGRNVAGSVPLQAVADIGMPVLHEFDQEKSWSF